MHQVQNESLPARFDEFVDATNEVNIARLAVLTAKEELARATAAVRSAEVRYTQSAQKLEILRREVFEHEAVAA